MAINAPVNELLRTTNKRMENSPVFVYSFRILRIR